MFDHIGLWNARPAWIYGHFKSSAVQPCNSAEVSLPNIFYGSERYLLSPPCPHTRGADNIWSFPHKVWPGALYMHHLCLCYKYVTVQWCILVFLIDFKPTASIRCIRHVVPYAKFADSAHHSMRKVQQLWIAPLYLPTQPSHWPTTRAISQAKIGTATTTTMTDQ